MGKLRRAFFHAGAKEYALIYGQAASERTSVANKLHLSFNLLFFQNFWGQFPPPWPPYILTPKLHYIHRTECCWGMVNRAGFGVRWGRRRLKINAILDHYTMLLKLAINHNSFFSPWFPGSKHQSQAVLLLKDVAFPKGQYPRDNRKCIQNYSYLSCVDRGASQWTHTQQK